MYYDNVLCFVIFLNFFISIFFLNFISIFFLGFSPNQVTSVDNELINGGPSQQYYDNMISQISNQIARVSEGGAASQQPFNTVLQKAPPVDDDDNEWC